MPFLSVWHKEPELRYTEAYTEPSPRTPASALRHGISTSDQLDPIHAVSTLDADMEGAIFLLGAAAACAGLPPPPPPCLPSASHQAMDILGFPNQAQLHIDVLRENTVFWN